MTKKQKIGNRAGTTAMLICLIALVSIWVTRPQKVTIERKLEPSTGRQQSRLPAIAYLLADFQLLARELAPTSREIRQTDRRFTGLAWNPLSESQRKKALESGAHKTRAIEKPEEQH